jgi:hypothetical protein
LAAGDVGLLGYPVQRVGQNVMVTVKGSYSADKRYRPTSLAVVAIVSKNAVDRVTYSFKYAYSSSPACLLTVISCTLLRLECIEINHTGLDHISSYLGFINTRITMSSSHTSDRSASIGSQDTFKRSSVLSSKANPNFALNEEEPGMFQILHLVLYVRD